MTALDDTKDPTAERSMVRRPAQLEILESDQYLLDHIGPELQQKIEQAKLLHDKVMRNHILAHYDLGLIVKDVYDDAQENGPRWARYGDKAMEKLRLAVPWSQSSLYDALRLVRSYTREQAEEFVAMRLNSGKAVTWTHVRCLAGVTNPKARAELLQRTVENSWTGDQLAQEMMHRKQLDAPKKPRRLPAPPSTLSGLIQQQRTYTEGFLQRDETAWKADGCGLLELSRSLSPREYTDEGATELKEHAQRLRRLAKAAEEQAQSAEAAHDRYVKTLERIKAKPPLAVEDAVEEAEEEE